MRLLFPVAGVPLAIALMSNLARGQFDDFNDGNDSGWTRYDPIGAFGNMAVYTFPHGGYRITAPGTGDPFVGGGRAGSLREDPSFSGFHIEVDLTDLDTSHSQAVGLLARIADPGLFTTDGYALTYAPQARALDLMRVDGEVLSTIASAPLPPGSDATSLRLAFTGIGANLIGQVFDDSNIRIPRASVSAVDRNYNPGFNGLLVEDTGDGNHGAAATFDNYTATFPGDGNLDGTVDFKDLVVLARNYGQASGATFSDGDFNGDRAVGFDDLTILAQNYGEHLSQSAPSIRQVPEPTVVLIVAVALVLLRGRGCL